MSIVKWSNVRLKTKDKKIITGQIEEMVLSGSMNNIVTYLILNIDYAASSPVNCTRKMISSRDIVEITEVFKPGTKVKMMQDAVNLRKDEICVVKEENSKEQLGEVVYTLRSVEHPDVTEKVISDCFSEIRFGLYRNDHMFI